MRSLLMLILCYSVVVLLYVSFFAYPVTEAEPSGWADFTIEAKQYSSFPNIFESIYTNGKALVAIATIRTISTPSTAFSMAFDRLDSYAEDNDVREQYGIDVDILIESKAADYPFAGHVATKYVYGVFNDVAIGYPPFQHIERVKVAEIGALAWFCNVDFESIVVFYVSPFYFDEDPALEALSGLTIDLVDDISCH
ncbi:MAG: hypothetical protein IH630_07025 [Thermoplasmata archaeon]|nr:hypothetical protein [Thermoplasmata archaeon]TFG70821.1 MAG: hypothetical protein E4H25_00930 [Methanomassiliicoccus sp.]